MTPLRLGLAGFGRLARDAYLPALRALPDVQLVGIADPLAASRAAARTRCPHIHVYDAVDALLHHEALDGLLVASPPSTHRRAWRAAAALGLPSFVEKPLLLASELSTLDASDARATVMVNFNRRFWAPYARARRVVASGILGTPVTLEFVLHLDVLGWSTVTQHRLAPDEGGLLHDLGSHAVDFASWMLDDTPREVVAVPATERWPDDRLQLTLRFPGGATAKADLAYSTRTRERFAVSGPSARLWMNEPNMGLHVRHAGHRPRRLTAHALDAATFAYRALRPPERVGRASVRGALAAFVHGMRTGRSFEPGMRAGLRNVHCIAAATEAARAGNPVAIEDNGV